MAWGASPTSGLDVSQVADTETSIRPKDSTGAKVEHKDNCQHICRGLRRPAREIIREGSEVIVIDLTFDGAHG